MGVAGTVKGAMRLLLPRTPPLFSSGVATFGSPRRVNKKPFSTVLKADTLDPDTKDGFRWDDKHHGTKQPRKHTAAYRAMDVHRCATAKWISGNC